MFKLVINKENDEHYWTEHFETREDLDKWLARETSRPYWELGNKVVITDLTPPPPSADELAAKAAAAKRGEDRRKLIKDSLKKGGLSAQELESLVVALAKEVFGD